ncbi:hypothetical protein AWW67_00635 [Roseivirga seohaensis]|uniref:DUF4760 domain-containing protein n=1 Tax=Roseivirga seohaensis TaxID=1914963 RepID=A0A150Y430_9BACT|nr:hypothetical protein [Roseivirga seohaensis]KYG85779.1 hypothetical protein AWW67_00635 [Roseivirga seohaensis]
MTLSDFNDNYAPLVELIFSASSIVMLVVVVYQFRKSAKWNQLQSKFNFLDIDKSAELQSELYRVLEELGCYSFPEKCEPIRKKDIKVIKSNREATFIINMFLNDMNNICSALNFGLINRNVFGAIHEDRVRWWYLILKPYIESRKLDYANEKIWADFIAMAQESIRSLEE